jgi:DNA polymerase I-like protein with 3'-5' exonuclease and polymerase domains/uracil-DNA glycosylase
MNGIIDQMTIAKPQTCIGCPLYSSTKMEIGTGVRPCSVLFLGSNPPPWGGLFTDNGGRILRLIINQLYSENPGSKAMLDLKAKHYFMYSVCCPGKAVNDVVDKCRSSVSLNNLLMAQPKVIVALGREACHMLGLTGNITDLRGTIREANIGGTKIKVMPTLPLATLDDSPGLYELVKNDVRKAAIEANGEHADEIVISELLNGYKTPLELTEAIDVLEYYSSYSAAGKSISNSLMALDFETNTLFSWNKNGRILAVSGSVGPGNAFAVLVDHRDSKYVFKDIAPYVAKLLGSKHPKTWWNYKYDFSMAKWCLTRMVKELVDDDPSYADKFENLSGIKLCEFLKAPIVNTRWDGLLGEHMLQEDKKGFYSLKEVVTEHFPSLTGYEDELHKLFNSKVELRRDLEISKYFNKLQDNKCTGIEVMSNSPIDGIEELNNLLDIPDIVSSRIKELKAYAKKKATSTHDKEKIAAIIDVYTNYLASVKEEISYAKSSLSSWYTSIVNSASSMCDPRRELTTYEDIDVSVMLPYACIDADLTWRISMEQKVRCVKEDPLINEAKTGRPAMIRLMDSHYVPLTEVLAEMQREGVRLDKDYLRLNLQRLSTESIELEEKIISKVKEDLGIEVTTTSINSHAAVANILIGGYGLPVQKKTESGASSTDRDTLEKYSEMGNEVAKMLLSYRDIAKASSTYVSAMLELADYDGRIHGAIHLNGTATGRASSSNPNLQNITSSIAGVNIKKAFVPTDTSALDGYEKELCDKYKWYKDEELVMVDIDFSGAEIRGLTAYVKDESLINALEKNLDIHSWIASVIFNEDYDTVNKLRKTDDKYHQMRQKAKTIVFGLIYGISNVGLADRLAIEVDEADKLMDTFFTRFPKIKKYIDDTKILVSRECILRTPTGRARRFPMAQMGGQVASRNHRQGINYLVQSFCAEIVLRIIANIHKNIWQIRGRLVLTVHDSIVMEIPKCNIDSIKPFLSSTVDKFIFDNFKQLPVNMPYDIKIGKSYGEVE